MFKGKNNENKIERIVFIVVIEKTPQQGLFINAFISIFSMISVAWRLKNLLLRGLLPA